MDALLVGEAWLTPFEIRGGKYGQISLRGRSGASCGKAVGKSAAKGSEASSACRPCGSLFHGQGRAFRQQRHTRRYDGGGHRSEKQRNCLQKALYGAKPWFGNGPMGVFENPRLCWVGRLPLRAQLRKAAHKHSGRRGQRVCRFLVGTQRQNYAREHGRRRKPGIFEGKTLPGVACLDDKKGMNMKKQDYCRKLENEQNCGAGGGFLPRAASKTARTAATG